MKKNTLAEAPYKKRFTYVDEFGNSSNTAIYVCDVLADYIPYSVSQNNPIEWRPNTPFDAELEIVSMERGRSSVVFVLRDFTANIEYRMFPTDTLELLKTASIRSGRVTGTWQIVKRGQNYGIMLLKPADEV